MSRQSLDSLVRHVGRLTSEAEERQWTDSQLLRQFVAQRDETAFATLLRRHGPLVWAVCRRVLGQDADVEDALQATFLVLSRKAASIRRTNSVASWLYGVACRVAMNMKKTSTRRQRYEKRTANRSSEEPGAQAAFRELQALLDEEVVSLPEKYRAPFVLNCLEGKSRSEVAQELGWKEGTVAGRVAEARKLLQQRLARRGVTFSSALGAAALAPNATLAAMPAATVQAVLAVALGKTETVSASVVAVAEKVIKGMGMVKLKLGALLALAFVVLAGGMGLAAYQTWPREPPETPETSELPSGAKTSIRPQPDAQDHVRADRFGDPLPTGAIARLGTVRLRHGYIVSSLVFSPDSKFLISGGWDNTIRLWEAETGKEIRRLVGHDAEVSSVALSNDGKTLLSGSEDKTVRVWELETGKELRRLTGHQGEVISVAISRDGRTVASGSTDKTIRLWDAATGKALHEIAGQRGKVVSVAFSPDGKMLASTTAPWGNELEPPKEQDPRIRLWEVATGKSMGAFVGHGQGVGIVAFSPDGKTLASASNDKTLADVTLRLWNVATRKEIRRWEGTKDKKRFVTLTFSPDGKVLAAGVMAQADNSDLVNGLADDKYKILLLDATTGEQIREFETGKAWCIAFSPNGHLLASTGWDRTIQIWETKTGKVLHDFDAHQGNVAAVAFFPNGKTLATGSYDFTLRLWSLETTKEIRQFQGHRQGVHHLALSPDGKIIATASFDDTLRLWEVATGKEFFRMFRPIIGPVAFSADGKLLASGGPNGTIELYTATTGKPLRSLDCGQRNSVWALAFSPDGKTVAGGYTDKFIRLWDLDSGKKILRLEWGGTWTKCLAFSPDGKTLASGTSDPTIRLWEIASGKQRGQLLGHIPEVTALAFSPDGRMLASSCEQRAEKEVQLWEVETNKEIAKLTGHQSGVMSVAFSPDGRMLASGSNDTTVLLWDVSALRIKLRQHDLALSRPDLEEQWNRLANEDASKAYTAIWTLAAAHKEAAPFLGDRLMALVRSDPKRIQALIADLNSEHFAVRQTATDKLEKLGEMAEWELRIAVEKPASAESRKSIEFLLDKLHGPIKSMQALQALRAIEVLEKTGTREAVRILATLAEERRADRFTQAAKASLERLAKRRETLP